MATTEFGHTVRRWRVQRLLDRLTGIPVAVFDAACTQLLASPLYTALMGEHHGDDRNALWRNFLDSGSRVRHTPQSLHTDPHAD